MRGWRRTWTSSTSTCQRRTWTRLQLSTRTREIFLIPPSFLKYIACYAQLLQRYWHRFDILGKGIVLINLFSWEFKSEKGRKNFISFFLYKGGSYFFSIKINIFANQFIRCKYIFGFNSFPCIESTVQFNEPAPYLTILEDHGHYLRVNKSV